MAAASAWESTRASSRVLGMPMQRGSEKNETVRLAQPHSFRTGRWAIGFERPDALSSPGALALHCRSDSICLRVGRLGSQCGSVRVREKRRHLVKSSAEKSCSLHPPAFCVQRGGGDGPSGRRMRVWGLWVRKNLQQVAPARLVGVRKRRRALEGVRVFANRARIVSRAPQWERGFERARALQCSVCLARSSCFVASHNAWHCA